MWRAAGCPHHLETPQRRIDEICMGTRGITADTALRLGRLFGMEAAFWLNLQNQYDLETTAAELGARLDAEVSPLSSTATYEAISVTPVSGSTSTSAM